MDIKSNDPFLISIRQYQNINDKNSLINVFPILVDNSLDKKYGQLCRSFLTVSMISQLKTNNILSITQTATTKDSPSNSTQNNVERMMQTLGYSAKGEYTSSRTEIERQQFQAQRNDLSRYEYQDKINNFLMFIKNQIQNDPQFVEFKPYISTITAENLLTIPLILGTKYYKVKTELLYWILFVGVATSTKLDSPSNVTKISKFMKMIPNDRYMDLFTIKSDFQFPRFITNPDQHGSQISSYIQNTRSQLDAAIGLLSDMLNENKWNEEVGFGSHTSVRVSTAIQQTAGIRQQIIDKTRSVMATFIANDVTQLIQNSSYTLVGSTDVDLNKYIVEMGDKILNVINTSSEIIIDMLKSGFEQTNTADEGDSLMDRFKVNCDNIGKISALQTLSQIKLASYNLKDNKPEEFLDFVQKINEPAAKLGILSNELSNIINNMSRFSGSSEYGSAKNLLKYGGKTSDDSLYGKIRKIIGDYYGYDDELGILRYKLDQTTINSIQSTINSSNITLKNNFANINPSDLSEKDLEKLLDDMNTLDNKTKQFIINSLNREVDASNNFDSEVVNIIQNLFDNTDESNIDFIITEINKIHDNYDNRVSQKFKAKLEKNIRRLENLKKLLGNETTLLNKIKNVGSERFRAITGGNDKADLGKYLDNLSTSLTEMIYFTTLYTILNYFCEYLREVEMKLDIQKTNALTFPHYTLVVPAEFIKGIYIALASHNFNELIKTGSTQDPKMASSIGDTDFKHMTRMISARLGVPNIIVISDKTGELVYKFAYMQVPVKVSISAIQNYVKHQSEVLHGF